MRPERCGVAEQVRDAILDRVGARPDTHFLEVGVGRVIISANEYTEQERRDLEGGRAPTGARLVTSRWNAILTELGLDRRRRPQGQWISDEALTADLERLGASVERVLLAQYQNRARTAREVAAAHRDRIYSSDWPIPDDIHAEAARRLDRWLETEHRAPDELFIDQSAVVVLIATFCDRDGAIEGTAA